MYDVLTSMYFLPIISFSFGIHVIINNQIWEDISLPINNVMYYLHGQKGIYLARTYYVQPYISLYPHQ